MRIPESAALWAVMIASIPAAAAELPSPFSLPDLLAALAERSPELRERRSRAEAAALRPRAEGLFDDPMLMLEWWQQPVSFSSVPVMLTVRQSLRWGSVRQAARRVAEREAATVRDQVDETARRLEAEAKRAYLDLTLAERTLAVNARVRTLNEAMVAAAEAKYRVGRAAQAEILRAQSELLTLDNDRLDLERARDEAQARINALLDRPGDAPLPPTAPVERAARLPPADALVAEAARRRPEVRLAEDALREAQARLEAARLTTRPELAVWAGYMVNFGGTDTFTVGASTTLPFFSAERRRPLVRAAEAEVAARRAALDAATRRADQEVRTALLLIETAERHARLHAEKLIPLAELSLRAAQAAYQNDRIEFSAVLDAARMVRDHHLNHERYSIEYQRRLADLELAVGADLPDSEDGR
jgi:outer membrane protein TolC